jgi:hypothetical protein
MLDLKIDRLNLNIEDANGHEHRIRPITTRAFGILADRLGERWATGERMPDTKNIEKFSVPPINLSLNRMSDEQAADYLAKTVLEALALKLGV